MMPYDWKEFIWMVKGPKSSPRERERMLRDQAQGSAFVGQVRIFVKCDPHTRPAAREQVDILPDFL
jgi:hypothetical protein